MKVRNKTTEPTSSFLMSIAENRKIGSLLVVIRVESYFCLYPRHLSLHGQQQCGLHTGQGHALRDLRDEWVEPAATGAAADGSPDRDQCPGNGGAVPTVCEGEEREWEQGTPRPVSGELSVRISLLTQAYY